MQLFSLLVTLLISVAWGFAPHHSNRHFIARTLSMSSVKTPLVGNGKRFEADPGSSLIVVSKVKEKKN